MINRLMLFLGLGVFAMTIGLTIMGYRLSTEVHYVTKQLEEVNDQQLAIIERAKLLNEQLKGFHEELDNATLRQGLAPRERSLVDLANKARLNKGMPELRPTRALFNVAREHARSMKEAKHLFAPKGLDRMLREHQYECEGVGVLVDKIRDIPRAKAFEDNLIEFVLDSRYDDIGVGIADCDEQPETYVISFLKSKKKR